MSEAAWLFFGTAFSVLSAAVVTVYGGRRSSPTGQATLFASSDKLMTQLQTRLEKLENRVACLERENDAYHRLYGPLPTTEE